MTQPCTHTAFFRYRRRDGVEVCIACYEQHTAAQCAAIERHLTPLAGQETGR